MDANESCENINGLEKSKHKYKEKIYDSEWRKEGNNETTEKRMKDIVSN